MSELLGKKPKHTESIRSKVDAALPVDVFIDNLDPTLVAISFHNMIKRINNLEEAGFVVPENKKQILRDEIDVFLKELKKNTGMTAKSTAKKLLPFDNENFDQGVKEMVEEAKDFLVKYGTL